MPVAVSCWSLAETMTILQSDYPLIKNKFKEIIINISENKPGGYHSTYDYYSSTLVPYILYFTLYKTVEWSPSALLWMINVMWAVVAAATAKLLQSCPTLCDHIDGSPPGFPVPGILQARTVEWVAISFSNEWTVKILEKSAGEFFHYFINGNLIQVWNKVQHP